MTEQTLPTVYLASSSQNKYNDYKYLLGNFADLQWFRLLVDEPLTPTVDILVRRKLNAAKAVLPYTAFFVEQTTLTIHVWQSLPGTVTGLFMDSVGNDGICDMMRAYNTEKERRATATTYLGYHAPDGIVKIFTGSIKGFIAPKPRGTNGYGWDAIFIPQGQKQTFAEMTEQKKIEMATRVLATTDFYTSIFKDADASNMAQNRAKFLELMTKAFNTAELEELAFQLGLDPEDLPGRVKREKARELILYFSRRRQIAKLLKATREMRTHIEWPDLI